ncbi:MAG: S8 family serine peptidase, partial [Anaerolineae bacterium]
MNYAIKEEDISALMAAEAQAHQDHYGKMERALFRRLQMLEDDDLLPVAVWMAAQPGKTLADQQHTAFTILAAKYPEAEAALETMGKPMDVDDPGLARLIYAEYTELLDAEARLRTQSLITELEHQGFAITAYEGIPSFAVALPKSVIVELSQREDVSSIALTEATKQPDMDSAAPTVLAPVVWGRGYEGSNVTLGILDIGNVDPNNTLLNLSPTSRPGAQGIFDHATETASAAASFHGTYTGIAPDATILSVGEDGTQADEILALQWAFDEGAQIINNSGGFEEDTDMHWTDRAFDYWTRERYRRVVKSSGNNGGGQYHLTSPGKAWNVLTVGGIEDNNTATWS